MTPERAAEVIEQAKAKAVRGPWSDQLKRVLTTAEIAYIVAKWETMPGYTSFKDCLMRIKNGEPTVYEQLKAAGVPMTNHASDLYCPVTETSRPIVQAAIAARAITCVKTFIDQVTGRPSYDIPFAFLPYWEAKHSGKPLAE